MSQKVSFEVENLIKSQTFFAVDFKSFKPYYETIFIDLVFFKDIEHPKSLKTTTGYRLAPKSLKITSDKCLAPKGSDQTIARPGAHLFLVGIDSEYFETNFKTKISKSKIFSRDILLLGLSRFLAKKTKIVKKLLRRTSERRGALQSGQILSELGRNLKLYLMASQLLLCTSGM